MDWDGSWTPTRLGTGDTRWQKKKKIFLNVNLLLTLSMYSRSNVNLRAWHSGNLFKSDPLPDQDLLKKESEQVEEKGRTVQA